ncbi:MAG: AAA family ATPase [Pontiellaceae bacterium]
MLRRLTIRNLAVVDDLQVGFGDGLNVITGETGAGKSLLMGALRLLLGERADRSLIRTGESQCTVLAEFGLSNSQAVNKVLEGLGHEPCEGGSLDYAPCHYGICEP